MNKRKLYKITLKDGKNIILWFLGTQFEKLLNDYNIPYEIVKEEKEWFH